MTETLLQGGFTSPVVLGGGALAVLVLVGGVLAYRRRVGARSAERDDREPLDDVIDEAADEVRSFGVKNGTAAYAVDEARSAQSDGQEEAARYHAEAAFRLVATERSLLEQITELQRRVDQEYPGDLPQTTKSIEQARRRVQTGRFGDARELIESADERLAESVLVHHGRGVKRYTDAETAFENDEYERARMLYGRASKAFSEARWVLLRQVEDAEEEPRVDLGELREELSSVRDGRVPRIESAESAAERIERTVEKCDRRAAVAGARDRIQRAERTEESARERFDAGDYESAVREYTDATDTYEEALSTLRDQDVDTVLGFDPDDLEERVERCRIRGAVSRLLEDDLDPGENPGGELASIVETSPERASLVVDLLGECFAVSADEPRPPVVRAAAAVATAAPQAAQPLAGEVVGLLGADDPDPRRDALRVLGATGEFETLGVDDLGAIEGVKAHRDDDELVREAAETVFERLDSLRIDHLRERVETDPHSLSAEEYAELVGRDDADLKASGLEGLSTAAERRPEVAEGLVDELVASLDGLATADLAAETLGHVAGEDPSSVPLDALFDALEETVHDDVRETILSAMVTVAERRPDELAERVETIHQYLDADREGIREAAVGVLETLETDSNDVDLPESSVPALVETLSDGGDHLVGGATTVLAARATDDPGEVLDSFPDLVERRAERPAIAADVDEVLGPIADRERRTAESDPEAVLEDRSRVLELLAAEGFDRRETVVETVRLLVEHDPDAAVDDRLVEALESVLAEDGPQPLGEVADLVATVADDDPDRVRELVGDLVAGYEEGDPEEWRALLRAVARTEYVEEIDEDSPALLNAARAHTDDDDPEVSEAASALEERLELNRVERLHERATDHPEEFDLDELQELLESEHATVRAEATGVAATYSEARPGDATGLVGTLVGLLDDGDCRDPAKTALEHVGDAREVPLRVVRRFTEGTLSAPHPRAAALARMVVEAPDSFLDRSDFFVSVLDSSDDPDHRERAAEALSAITRRRPGALGSPAEAYDFWREYCEDESAAPGLRAVAAEATAELAGVADAVPDPETVASLLEASSPELQVAGCDPLEVLAAEDPLALRALLGTLLSGAEATRERVRSASLAALGALADGYGDLADDDPAAVLDDLEVVLELLHVPDDQVRGPAAGALRSVAVSDPVALSDHGLGPDLAELLATDSDPVSENAAVCLAALARTYGDVTVESLADDPVPVDRPLSDPEWDAREAIHETAMEVAAMTTTPSEDGDTEAPASQDVGSDGEEIYDPAAHGGGETEQIYDPTVHGGGETGEVWDPAEAGGTGTGVLWGPVDDPGYGVTADHYLLAASEALYQGAVEAVYVALDRAYAMASLASVEAEVREAISGAEEARADRGEDWYDRLMIATTDLENARATMQETDTEAAPRDVAERFEELEAQLDEQYEAVEEARQLAEVGQQRGKAEEEVATGNRYVKRGEYDEARAAFTTARRHYRSALTTAREHGADSVPDIEDALDDLEERIEECEDELNGSGD